MEFKIAVCIKAIPKEFLLKGGFVVRNKLIANPPDLCAIELALRIKEKIKDKDTKVICLSMGPQEAAEALKSVLYLGADYGVLITDNQLKGADIYLTSLVLSKFIKDEGFDLIICGLFSEDSGTGVLAGYLAGMLNLPFLANVKEVLDVKDDKIYLLRYMNQKEEEYLIKIPCLLSASLSIRPRVPKLSLMLRKLQIHTLSLSDLKLHDFSSLTRISQVKPRPQSKKDTHTQFITEIEKIKEIFKQLKA